MWKSKCSKPSLSIRDTTEHQRKHLNSVNRIKSRIDLSQPWKKSTSNTKLVKTQTSFLSPYTRYKIQHQNSVLADKIINIEKRLIKKQPSQNKYSQISQSLSHIVNSNRSRYDKILQKQNASIFQRLAATKPVYKHKSLLKFASDSIKYKSNILQTKLHNVDYTRLAEKNRPNNKFKLVRINDR